MKRMVERHHIGWLAVLLLFCVFAGSILMVLLMGARDYQRLTERDRRGFDQRTAVQYLASRVRAADRVQGVAVGPFDGENQEQTLFLYETVDGERYYTRVYCYDGYLRELFAGEGDSFSPEDGERILEAQQLKLNMTDHVLDLSVTAGDGTELELSLTLRSGKTLTIDGGRGA